MQKLIFYIVFLAVVKGFGQKLEFNPKKDHPYPFETELVVYNTSSVNLALKTTIETSFLKNDGFSMKVNRFQAKSSIITIDSDKLESLDRDSTKIKEIISKPFIFKLEEGILKLVSHTDIDKIDKAQKALKEFGKYYSPNYNPFYKGIVLKKGYAWSVTDSISSSFIEAKDQVVTFNYTVKDITRKEVTLYGKSKLIRKRDTTNLAVKYIFNKRTGIPLYTKFISHNNDEVSVFMINKLKDYEAPNMLEEFTTIEHDLFYSSFMEYNDFDNSIEYEYLNEPLLTNKKTLEKAISQALDSLTLNNHTGREGMYYLTDINYFKENVMDSILLGAYSKVNTIKFLDKNGEAISLKSDKNVLYNNPIYIGPYYSDLYQSNPKIEKVELDVTTFKPTKRKTVVLNSNTTHADYDYKIADSIVTFTFNYKEYLNIDYRSFRFFDKNGKELKAKLIPNYIYENLITNGEAFTQKFIEQIPGENKIPYTIKFIVKNASKLSFDILTDDLKFRHKKIISRVKI